MCLLVRTSKLTLRTSCLATIPQSDWCPRVPAQGVSFGKWKTTLEGIYSQIKTRASGAP